MELFSHFFGLVEAKSAEVFGFKEIIGVGLKMGVVNSKGEFGLTTGIFFVNHSDFAVMGLQLFQPSLQTVNLVLQFLHVLQFEEDLNGADILVAVLLLNPVEVLRNRLVYQELFLLVGVQEQFNRFAIDHHSQPASILIINLYNIQILSQI